MIRYFGRGTSVASTDRDAARARLAWAGLGTGAVTWVAWYLLHDGEVTSVGYLLVAAVGLVMSCLGAALVRGTRKRIWVMIAAGQGLYFIGDVLWVLFESVLHIAPYPSFADVAYLARYPLVAVALMWLIRGRRRGRDRAAFLDAAIISTGFAVLGGVFVVVPAAAGGGESLLSQVVAGAYPVADLLVFAVLVRLFTGGAARSLSFWALAAGMAVMLAVDVQYLLTIVSGLQLPSWLNIGYLITYLLIGFSALHPSVDRLSEPTPERPKRITFVRLGMLGAALALAPLTEVLRDAKGDGGVSGIVLGGGVVGIVLVLLRIWDLLHTLQEQAVQLAALARNDSLTGVANRRTWDHELSRACAVAREHGSPLTVAIIDLDHFKGFNDTYGHVVGDLVLKETAAAWNALIDGRGCLARFGGEEFTVLLPNIAPNDAETLIDRFRAVVTHQQTCSIGVAIWDGRENPDALVSRADQALYHAKRTGRDRIAIHDGVKVRDPVAQGLDPILTCLRTVYQPIVELETGTPIAYEALSRFDGRDAREVFDNAARLGRATALEVAAIGSALENWTWAAPLAINVSLSALVDPPTSRRCCPRTSPG